MVLLISLLLTTYRSQALTAKTSNIIHGNAPYLTFDGGLTSVTSSEGFLWITLSNGVKFTPASNNSSINPIKLPNSGQSFADIGMLVPTDSNSIALNSLIGSPNNYWGDNDGDGQGFNGIAATGNLSLSIVDKNDNAVARNEVLTICDAPYKVTLMSTDGTLRTRYGVPNSSSFSASSTTYYVNPNEHPKVCFAKPNLIYGSNTEINGIDFRGPVSIWNSNKGFIPQSTNPSSYHLNFPTTGANNLYFDLDIGGAGSLIWPEKIEHGGITATLEPNSTGTSVRVTLTGPTASPSQWVSSETNKILRPELPQLFELVGKDKDGNVVVSYGFELKQWFINRGTDKYDYANTLSWCNHIKNYRLPKVKDLTNSVCSGIWSNFRCNGIVGALPPSVGNHYQRNIGAGLFSEWGYMGNYNNAYFGNGDYYWTGDKANNSIDPLYFGVSSDGGHVLWSNDLNYSIYGICVSL